MELKKKGKKEVHVYRHRTSCVRVACGIYEYTRPAVLIKVFQKRIRFLLKLDQKFSVELLRIRLE